MLPGVLDRHQQHVEDIKSFLNLLFNLYSTVQLGLSTSCSTSLSSNRAFSTSQFIALHHRGTGQEASHALLQKVHYRNYMLHGEVTRPLFAGGVEKTVWLVNQLLAYDHLYLTDFNNDENWMDSAFDLENEATSTELPALLERLTGMKRAQLRMSAYLMDVPLLLLPGDVILKYQNGISRKELSRVMGGYLPFAREEVLTLTVQLVDRKRAVLPRDSSFKRIAIHLSHNILAAGVIESIWRKWDINNDRPLREGVERVWNEPKKESEVVWSKNGKLYYARRSRSSS